MTDRDEFARDRIAANAPDEESQESQVSTHPVLHAIDTVWEVCGVAAMVAATLLIFLNASARYLLSRSINWADEVVIGLIPWIAMIGLYLSIRRGSVIRIEYFFYKFSPRYRAAVTVFTSLLSAIAFVQLGIYSFQYLQFFGTDVTPYLGIMRGWFTSALVVGCVASTLLFAAEALKPIVGRLRARRGESIE